MPHFSPSPLTAAEQRALLAVSTGHPRDCAIFVALGTSRARRDRPERGPHLRELPRPAPRATHRRHFLGSRSTPPMRLWRLQRHAHPR